MDYSEKRIENRMKASMPVCLISPTKDGNTTIVSSSNLSVDGICLKTDLLLDQNERIELELSTSVGKLRLKSEVIWSRENQYECKFVEVDPITRGLLSQWLYPPFEP